MDKHYFEIRNGKIISYFPLSRLKDGKYFLQEVKTIRSSQQNRLYWGYILKFIVLRYKDFGYIHTKDDLHNIFKKAFIPRKREYSDLSKKYVIKLGKSSELNTKQFSEYIKNIKIIFEFGEMGKLGLEDIGPLLIPDITDQELEYWETQII